MDEEIPQEFQGGEEIIQKVVKYNGKNESFTYIKGNKIGAGGYGICYKFYCLNDKKIYAAKKNK